MTTAIQPVVVPFHQDAISCLPGDAPEDFKVVFKPTCESMGLEHASQLRRLKRRHWATVVMMTTVDSAGSVREFVCLDRQTFAYWLATIDTRRLADPAIRHKVELYQLEAADVLDRHFFGEPAPATAVPIEDERWTMVVLAQQLTSAVPAPPGAGRGRSRGRKVAPKVNFPKPPKPPVRPGVERACRWLSAYLADGPKRLSDIRKVARKQQISSKTLYDARDHLGLGDSTTEGYKWWEIGSRN